LTKNNENPQFSNNLSFKKIHIYNIIRKNGNKIVETFVKECELFVFVRFYKVLIFERKNMIRIKVNILALFLHTKNPKHCVET
jgi:hypothetical protein